MERSEIAAWLLDGDPAIAWQTERDLLRARRGSTSARAGGSPSPVGARRSSRSARPTGVGRRRTVHAKWTSTFYTLQLLVLLGVGREEAAMFQAAVQYARHGRVPPAKKKPSAKKTSPAKNAFWVIRGGKTAAVAR